METKRELIEVVKLKPWDLNPRGGDLRGIEEFAAQIEADGGIQEDLHIWLDNGVPTIMQGHRRHAAAVRLGVPAVWCKVLPFVDSRDAFKHLLTLQQGVDPFDSRELAVAARKGIDLGIPREELVGVLHRSEETVQLYLDLHTLPHCAQEAVWKGRLALETAGLLRKVDGVEAQREAVQMVLHDAVTKEPMSTAQARHFIEETYLKPARWRKAWLAGLPKLKKKHPVADGFQFVEWEQRGQFVAGEVGYCLQGYRMADEHIEAALLMNPKEPQTWGGLAQVHQAAIYVVAAPNHKEGYVLVVDQAMVRDAESTRPEGERVLRLKESRKAPAPMSAEAADALGVETMNAADADDAPEPIEPADDESEMVASAQVRELVRELAENPAAAMRTELWEPLVRQAFDLAAVHVPQGLHAELLGVMAGDKAPRHALRWCLTALFAAQACTDDEDGAAQQVLERL